jgi:hypothetical protein
MGWASGSGLFGNLIDIMMEHIPDKDMRVALYMDMIEAFENRDCDTLDECYGHDPAFDIAWRETYPDLDAYDEDEEE